MGSYEFWDELGKIFNAVVAYQEKNLEFNKRFINPWIRLGNVFGKQDRSNEAISAYKQAIEIDPENSQNWLELGNIHFKMEGYDAAIEAFQRAIELDPKMGWAYSNLALALAAEGNHEQAIPLYQRSIELLTADKDRAVAWNRLGNAYRKLNKYQQAVEAFQKADELDRENAGFRDDLDEVPEEPTVVQAGSAGDAGTPETVIVNPIELIVADSRADEAAWQSNDPARAIIEAAADITDSASTGGEKQVADISGAQAAVRANMTEITDEQQTPVQAQVEEIVTGVVKGSNETFAPAAAFSDIITETIGSEPALEPQTEAADGSAPGLAAIVTEYTGPSAEPEATQAYAEVEETDSQQFPESAENYGAGAQTEGSPEDDLRPQAPEGLTEDYASEALQPAVESIDTLGGSTSEAPGTQGAATVQSGEHDAYEEYLKDTNEPLDMYAPAAAKEDNAAAPQAPVTKIDSSGELQIEMDTKNAHVWNELGNVYYNTGAFDDAIIAYSKAIELDRWFAWPYSNLALAYVQKRRFVEAILLYQRSIDLFTSGKDKAISWNRLGNVYRRLNDYENAIAAYQQADELDPDNTTLSMQSRFSLLGSYALGQKPSYVSS